MAICDDIWGAVRHTHDDVTESVGAIAHDTRSKLNSQWRNLVGRFTLGGEDYEHVTFVDNNLGEVRVREVGGAPVLEGRLHVVTANGTRYLVTFGD